LMLMIQRIVSMEDHILSPDGKWLWNGSEWIAAPPNLSRNGTNARDSILTEDVAVTSSREDSNPVDINFQDTAMSGDIIISQNNPEDIATAVVMALDELGFSGINSPKTLSTQQQDELMRVLDTAELAHKQGVEVEPWAEFSLGMAAELVGQNSTAQGHFRIALVSFRSKKDRRGEAATLNKLGALVFLDSNEESKRYFVESLTISREIGDRIQESTSIRWHGTHEIQCQEYNKANRFYLESLSISREIGDWQGEADSLRSLGENWWRPTRPMREEIDPLKIKSYFQESIIISRDNGDRNGEAKTLLALAYYHSGALKQMNKAIQYNYQALAIYKEIGNSLGQLWIIESLIELEVAVRPEDAYGAKVGRLIQEGIVISQESGNLELEMYFIGLKDGYSNKTW
jgi:tetratricopeptide (TPR) repeat protein